VADRQTAVVAEQFPMWRFLCLSLLAVGHLAVPALADPAPGDDVAICRARQDDLQARQDACERVIADTKAAPKDMAVAYAVRGDALLKKRNLDKAIEAYSKGIELDPDHVGLLNGRGWAHESKGQDDLALADYNLALRKRSNFPMAYNNRGTLYLRQGALQSALDDFDAALKIKGDLYHPHLNRGRVLLLNRDYEGALAEFAAAEAADPKPGQPSAFRCNVYTEQGKLDDAIDECGKAIARYPNYQYAVTSRAEAYIRKGNLDAALKDLNGVLAVNPNNIFAHLERGEIFERRRDLAQARTDYRSAAFALTKFDELDIAMARKKAQARLAALTEQGPAGSAGRRIALVIGNGAYKNVHALDNPPRDAKLIADSLKGLGFQTVTLANDLTRNKFFETLKAFAAEADKSDWAVVYYAGHGFEIGGVNYLVPIDAKLKIDKDAETEAVALEQVIAAASGARGLRLLMLDACRDNPFAPTMQHTIALKLVDKGFSNIEPSAGFMVVYAAKHGETALDGEGADSPFATAVARELKEHVEVRKLFDIVRDDVWTATKHAQQPFTYGSPPGREDFYFATAAANAAPASQAAPPAKKK
jgi:tetratricopeptide (TPR) repeat protein